MKENTKKHVLPGKRSIARLLLTALLCTFLVEPLGGSIGFISTAQAASDEATQAADELHELGLFQGSGTDTNGDPIYDLDRAPTRTEAVVMLVRLLDKEEEAANGTWETPFTDVDGWAKPYIGYAYANKLVSGTGATTFGGSSTMTATQYITLLLRVLGYESGVDFSWDRAWELSDQIGLTDGSYRTTNNDHFLRGDAAVISLSFYQLRQTLATAPYWGLPANIRWIAQPETQDELDNNILYSFLFGNYSLYFTNVDSYFARVTGSSEMDFEATHQIMQERIKALSKTYPELVGVFSNTFVGCGTRPEGIFIDFPESSLTTDTVYTQQLAVLQEALRIKDELHKKGKIQNGMSQMQIAKVYEEYLLNLNVKPGIGKRDATCPEYDSPYAALVNKKADCVGRAGSFNLLMHMEGIPAQGVAGSFKNTGSGHVLSRVVLDGEEYFSDWGNRSLIGTKEQYETEHQFCFEEDSLSTARSNFTEHS